MNLFIPYQEILLFSPQHLFKSANIPNLFSYLFDTTIHLHPCTQPILTDMLAHPYAYMTLLAGAAEYTEYISAEG